VTLSLSATTVPTTTPVRHYSLNGWDRLDIAYQGWPIYVSRLNGAVAYEVAGTQLVSLPEEVEDGIMEILLMDVLIQELTPEARHALQVRKGLN
jgi:hypothetical protein